MFPSPFGPIDTDGSNPACPGWAIDLGTLGGNYPHYVALATSRAAPAAALLAAAVLLADSVPALLVPWTVAGFASGSVRPTIFAWLGRLSPGGGGFAILATANMFVFAFGPPLMGQLSVLGLEWPFRAAALLTLIAAGLVVLTTRRLARTV